MTYFTLSNFNYELERNVDIPFFFYIIQVSYCVSISKS